MAYYCQVTGLSRPNIGQIIVHFNMHDDTDDSIVQGPMSHGFSVTLLDANGAPVAETANQKKQRMATEFSAYAASLITAATLVDANFAALEAQAVGFRYPAAG